MLLHNLQQQQQPPLFLSKPPNSEELIRKHALFKPHKGQKILDLPHKQSSPDYLTFVSQPAGFTHECQACVKVTRMYRSSPLPLLITLKTGNKTSEHLATECYGLPPSRALEFTCISFSAFQIP